MSAAESEKKLKADAGEHLKAIVDAVDDGRRSRVIRDASTGLDITRDFTEAEQEKIWQAVQSQNVQANPRPTRMRLSEETGTDGTDRRLVDLGETRLSFDPGMPVTLHFDETDDALPFEGVESIVVKLSHLTPKMKLRRGLRANKWGDRRAYGDVGGWLWRDRVADLPIECTPIESVDPSRVFVFEAVKLWSEYRDLLHEAHMQMRFIGWAILGGGIESPQRKPKKPSARLMRGRGL